jgi:predicted dehydrogenase
MKPKKIALIGCGRIGFLLEDDPLRYKPCTHFGGCTAAGMRITHACDIAPERLGAFAGRACIAAENTSASFEKLITCARPDMVIISTWTESHARIGMLASDSGARVIVCEKPLCADLKEAGALIRRCEKNGTRLIVNHERRFDDRYIAVRELIERGRIGAVKTVHASVLSGPWHGRPDLRMGGGPLLHDGTHMLDILRYLFGDFLCVEGEIQRDARRSGFEDRASAWITTRSGIDIFLEAGGSREYFIFELVIGGTAGKIVIGNGYQSLHVPEKSRFYTGFRDLKERPLPWRRKMNYFQREYTEARRILEGRDDAASSTGMDGYRALEAAHAIYLSASLGRKTIALPVKPASIDLSVIFNL